MVIRRVTLRRFRQFEYLVWEPSEGINCLIGPGDSGKTTILEAISRATSPSPYGPAAEHDYFLRRTDDGFEIELVIGAIDDEVKAMYRPPALWGWRGPGQGLLEAPVEGSEPVLVVLARGTPDLELEHRVRSPEGDELTFSADRRRRLGLCRVGDSRGSAREFRMARGSLLERTLGRDEVRGAAASAVREASKLLKIPSEVTERLEDLAERLVRDGLVTDPLTLEILSPPGQSLLGLLGIALGEAGEAIPLSQSGQGTQRLASFLLARTLAQAPALVVIDELEVGLEPYRRRLLVQRLRQLLKGGGQAFVTTHSSTVLSELTVSELHRLDWRLTPTTGRHGSAPTARDSDSGGRQPQLTRFSANLARAKDENAEALLCRLPIVCEGQTEVAVLRRLLDVQAVARGYSLAALGVQMVDGGGQPQVFGVVDGYCDAGFQLGLFLDEEQKHRGQRDERAARGDVIAGKWLDAVCTEHALAQELTLEQLDELLKIGDAEDERLAERRRKQLCAKLSHEGEAGVVELSAVYGDSNVRDAWGAVAHKPSKKQAGWFKSRQHANALADWLVANGLPARMDRAVVGFWDKIARAVAGPKADETQPGGSGNA
jgi:putative ATP-dependent endonuclease of the OLD family